MHFPDEIFDAHHHLWDLDVVHYPWLAAKGVPRFFGDPEPIQKNYLPSDLKQDIGKLPITKTVHIQVGAAPDQHIAESTWVQQMADGHSIPNAIVAYCDLEQNHRSEMLDQLQSLPLLRGIRQIVGRSPEEDKTTGSGNLLSNSIWLEGLQDLAQRNLSFDLQLIPDQMQQAYDVFSQVEELPVVLCHAGSPWYRDTEGWALWKKGLERLATLPNVYCKISGLGMFDRSWTVDSLRPVFETVIDTFGVQRCMLGSNFPVDKLYREYDAYWQAYLSLSQDFSENERNLLFKANCQQFYNI